MGGSLSALGPGMGALDALPRAVTLLCRPTFGIALMPEGAWGAGGFALVALMWGAMAFAMMLPSAGPMILTYAEIAETASAKGERIVSPFVLGGRLCRGLARLCRGGARSRNSPSPGWR